MAPAQIGAVNYTSFEPQGVNGFGENPTVDGMCKLRYERGQDRTGVHLTITGLLPGTTYGLNVTCPTTAQGFNNPQAFTTNPHGDGSFHGYFPQAADSTTTVQVYIWDPINDPFPQDTILDSEQRADAVLELD
jgi:hypothetical protein